MGQSNGMHFGFIRRTVASAKKKGNTQASEELDGGEEGVGMAKLVEGTTAMRSVTLAKREGGRRAVGDLKPAMGIPEDRLYMNLYANSIGPPGTSWKLKKE